VHRYLLPKFNAMSSALRDLLDDDVNEALNLDSHEKTLSGHLLSLPCDTS
jgi:hypothetical protein